MKTDIESIIKENLHRFEANELPDGYLHNFEKRLNRNRRRFMITLTAMVSTVAAAVIALFIVLNPVQEGVNGNNSQEKEIAEIRAYYENQHERTIMMINKLLEQVEPAIRAEITAELATMQKEDIEFRNQFNNMINAEQYLAQEVRYYQTRQESLEYIQTILSK